MNANGKMKKHNLSAQQRFKLAMQVNADRAELSKSRDSFTLLAQRYATQLGFEITAANMKFSIQAAGIEKPIAAQTHNSAGGIHGYKGRLSRIERILLDFGKSLGYSHPLLADIEAERSPAKAVE